MTRLRFGTATVGCLALVGVLTSAGPATAKKPDVPSALVPPAGQEQVASLLGAGVQVYDCVGTTWTFREPNAVLLEKKRFVGTHYAGPTWESLRDGSTVTGAVQARVAAAHPTRDIPLLLLRATGNTGSGVFSEVDFVQRLDTRGGVAPAGGCDAAVQSVARVPYTATYVFFAPAD